MMCGNVVASYRVPQLYVERICDLELGRLEFIKLVLTVELSSRAKIHEG